MWTKILHISGWVIGLACLFLLLGGAVNTSGNTHLTAVNVHIDFGEGNFFIDEKQVSEVVVDLGYTPDSTAILDINPSRIELVLENDPFIRSAEVYSELNGALHVDVEVRQPILRIYNLSGQSVYLDQDGNFMPLSSRYTARTPIANGYITTDLRSFIGYNITQLADSIAHPDMATLRDLYDIVGYCRADKFWKAQFNQFHVTVEEEIEAIPRVGDHIVMLGNAQNLDKKLNKLRLFYDKGLSKTGWNEYKTINLKYASQVVCTKS